ncbi:MAG: hypothetical protein JKY71_09980 [Alphaproteobacteria bacterium]|nr:hypothetical protein [Alphaproteobacteria bacterium]
MSLETQTHSNLLFNVSTDQYADLAADAKRKAAKANGVSADNVRTKTVLQKETALSAVFGVGAKTIEVDGTEDLAKIDKGEWKGATAVTTFSSKKGESLGGVSSSSDSGRDATISIANKDSKPSPISSVSDFDTASLYSMLSAVSSSKSDLSNTTAMDKAMPPVFTAEEPIGIFGTPSNDTPSFASFVEAVSTKLDSADASFDDGEFLTDMKVAMPGFFQLLAANDDEGPGFGGRAINGYAQEAVTFAHEGLGVRRDVIDMRQGEAQERFMSTMKRIADYEADSGHHQTSTFGLDAA